MLGLFMSNTTALVFASGLDYGLVSSAPPIRRDDIALWKTRVSPDVEHHFVERYEELRQQYERLLADYETNRLLYNSEINFTPVVGHIYYLYDYHDKRFLSLIAPQHSGWPGYLGAFRLSSSHTWERV